MLRIASGFFFIVLGLFMMAAGAMGLNAPLMDFLSIFFGISYIVLYSVITSEAIYIYLNPNLKP